MCRITVTIFNNYRNEATEKIVPVLIGCLQNNHSLTELVLPKNSSTTCIEKAVNDVRKSRELPLIKVYGMSKAVPLNKFHRAVCIAIYSNTH